MHNAAMCVQSPLALKLALGIPHLCHTQGREYQGSNNGPTNLDGLVGGPAKEKVAPGGQRPNGALMPHKRALALERMGRANEVEAINTAKLRLQVGNFARNLADGAPRITQISTQPSKVALHERCRNNF
jgi:hypothetical protein